MIDTSVIAFVAVVGLVLLALRQSGTSKKNNNNNNNRPNNHSL